MYYDKLSPPPPIQYRNINFKGYDAAPLKRIYSDGEYCHAFESEMEQISKEEGISFEILYDKTKWAQDGKTIIEKNGTPFLIGNNKISAGLLYTMFGWHGIQGTREEGFLTGGNTFIGKFPNGEKWLLSGEDNTTDDKEKISKTYNIKPENIHFIPQQNYHLDMFIRPVGYPYVLVNDPELVKKNIDKLEGTQEDKERFKEEFERYCNFQKIYGYTSCDTTVEKLEELGFIPIRIAGDYGWAVNFMNGIVNKHADGSISYITNSTKCKDKLHSSIEKVFKKDLQTKIPNLDKSYFISGKNEIWTNNRNFMMGALEGEGGGIHCMSLEEPDFEMWA